MDTLHRCRTNPGLGQCPAESSGRAEGAVDADHDSGLDRSERRLFGIGMDDHDGAMGVLDALVGDGSEKELDEPALATGPDHQQLR